MKVKIKRLDPTLPLPEYATPGAVGFDLLAREKLVIPPHQIALIPANVIIETPPGYMLLVSLRSSTPRRKGLLQPHGIGIIDQDYCGAGDEIKIQVYNFTAAPVEVDRGEKIGQAVFVRVNQCEWEEMTTMNRPTRGGFGSTTP
ncbi:dUTP diphosphatase [candidate division KSB1 bacterium]|nr:dUTP diphosphatase [candidate division KSB1 bacterium]